jgi:hypothetical protein
MKALILDNAIVDVVEVEFEVHESLTWIDCPDECTVSGWELLNGVFQLIPEPPDNRTYAEKRAQEYPPMTDYLDGVVKNDQAQIDKYIADCQAVKTRYPKP